MYRSACGIKTFNKYVITGGKTSGLRVTSYSRTGETLTLPQLNVARSDHACGSYLTEEGDNVTFILNINKYLIIVM